MKIRVTCPACHDTLEVDDQHVGQQVECGSCLQPFTVEDPAAKKPKKYKMRRTEEEDEDDRPAKKPPRFKGRRRRRDNDEDEDDQYDEPRPSGGATILSLTLGTFALVAGVLSLVMCWCFPLGLGLGITAMVVGGKARHDPVGRSMGVIGSALGSLAVLAAICFGVWLMQGGFKQLR
jgi:hypothetical protein